MKNEYGIVSAFFIVSFIMIFGFAAGASASNVSSSNQSLLAASAGLSL